MKKPLFSVGEEVILRSEAYPEYNGDAVVLDIRFDYDDGLPGYLLTIPCPKDEEGDDLWWDEPALRKKYKPSELSFQELVSSLKTPIKA